MERLLRKKSWDRLTLEEKIEDLRDDIASLFSIVENLNHQDHVFTDAMHLVHSKLDHVSKSVKDVKKKTEAEPVE